MRTADPVGSPLPAIVVGVPGWQPGESGTLDALGEWQVPFVVVASVEAFPGVERRGVIVDAASIFAIVPDARQKPDPELNAGQLAGEFSAELWSARPSSELEAVFGPDTEGGAPLRTSAGFAQNSAIRGGAWPLGLLVAYGACAFMLGAAVLVLQGQRLAERDRVADLLLTRMGVRRGALDAVRVLELGRLVLWSCGIAIVSVLALAWSAPGLVDPAPRLAPAVRPALSWADVAVLAAAALVLVTVAAIAARARTVPAGEVLRGAG